MSVLQGLQQSTAGTCFSLLKRAPARLAPNLACVDLLQQRRLDRLAHPTRQDVGPKQGSKVELKQGFIQGSISREWVGRGGMAAGLGQ